MADSDDDNWLAAEVLACPGCGARLFAVLHSPFCDDHRLYCDRCPRAVEVSYYDATYSRVVDHSASSWDRIMAVIEPLLRPCDCGGPFRGRAARRCPACGVVVPAAADKDLSPYLGDDDDDPGEENLAAFEAFEAAFIRRAAVWTDADEP